MKHDREDCYDSAAERREDLDVILTTPLGQSGGKASAAIPQQAVAQDRRPGHGEVRPARE